MTHKIIALDLDGTLLRSDNTISDYTVDTLKKIAKLGHQIVIVTGRPYRMSIKPYKRLGLGGPMINFNGALTHIPETSWTGELNVKIDKNYLFEVLENYDAFETDFLASEYQKNFYITMENRQLIPPEIFGVNHITDDMRLIPEKITRDPNALLMQTRAHDKYLLADQIQEHFQNGIEVDSWGGPLNILEFSPKGVNKAFALKHLLERLRKDKQDLIAFGDEHNDTEMLSFAGTGYAMKNASKALLPYADNQTKYSNEEDGVARQLAKLFL
ncbi:Cof-type HAD-IIB family hydrolase [Streptococcus dentapri]|uniref:Cof-type HAD-IIB family hydrolase n=1 Tax=Streptococcus dentapri TaxID=573564 RepID=A0ABV8D1J6_9STRE